MSMVVERARTLRKNATDAERLLWRSLRKLKTQGVHFRRQAQFGYYFVDFACHRAKLIVELDGSQHGDDEHVQYDVERTKFLESRGYRVLRFWNADVMANTDGVVNFIFVEATARLSPHP
jgi:very-short-patch-repair endonuclease